MIVVQVGDKFRYSAQGLAASPARPVFDLAPCRSAGLECPYGVTRRLLDVIHVTPDVIFEMVATRKYFWTDDAVSRLVVLKVVWVMLPEVGHAGAEAHALGETNVAAEDGLGAPVFFRSEFAWRRPEPVS